MMGNNVPLYTKEQIDYFTEAMSIGAGNAATAFSQLLKRNVELTAPKVLVLSDFLKVKDVLRQMPDEVDIVSMKVIGEVGGDIYLTIITAKEAEIVAMMKESFFKEGKYPDYIPEKNKEFDTSVIAEIGNILVGVYFTALFEFSRIRIYHTVPTVSVVSISDFFDALALSAPEDTVIVVVENEFIVSEKNIRLCLLLKTTKDNVKKIMDSMKRNNK